MAQKDIKKLTANEFKKQVKKLDEKQTFIVTINDEDYKMEHDITFRKTKMNKVLDDLVKFFNEGGNHLELLDLATPYTALLVLKHFTSLEVSDDIDEALMLLEALVDMNVLGTILNALPEDQVKEIYDLITLTVDKFRENIEEMEQEVQSLTEELESPELKEMIESAQRDTEGDTE